MPISTRHRAAFLPTLLALALLGWGCNPSGPDYAAKGKEIKAVTKTLQAPTPELADIGLQSQEARVIVMMYHDVVERKGAASGTDVWFDLTAAELRAQLELIRDDGGTVISMDDLYKHLTSGRPVPEKSVVLTFDDNYQGVYDVALPILREYQAPFTVFIHTAFVGSKQGRPKMSWDTLKELSKDPLVTLASHTVHHPEDITRLGAEEQAKELNDSKQALESKLGIDVHYLSYPIGKNDEVTRRLTKEAGYRMAVTMESGFAEESPDIWRINRYGHNKLEEAWQRREKAREIMPIGVADVRWRDASITYELAEYEGVDMSLIKGGRPEARHVLGRQSVGEFIAQTGAEAGINGGFFAMAAIRSQDNRMVGPFLAGNRGEFQPDLDATRVAKIKYRPIVIFGPTRLAVVPFNPFRMNFEETFRAFMPDMTDVFLGGVWLVHQGVARTGPQLTTYGAKDIEDARRRAFFGVMMDGTIVLGASRQSVSSSRLAEAAAAAGVQEAVLLDSGFSTSLVYGDRILASGHSTPDTPSRPVPHAIVVHGEYGALSLEQESELGELPQSIAPPTLLEAAADPDLDGEAATMQPTSTP